MRIGVLAVSTLLALTFPLAAAAAPAAAGQKTGIDAGDQGPVEAEPAEVPEQIKLVPKHVLGELVTFATSPRTVPAVGLAAAVGIATSHARVDREHDTIDQDFREHISDPFNDRPRPAYFRLANIGANPIGLLSGAAALYGLGRWRHSTPLVNTSLALGEGVAVDQLLVQALKYALPRRRPDASNDRSFPSGHVTDAMMMATVLGDRWGWRARVPGFVYAAFTAYSRMEADKHWLSDTVFGAGLGLATGLAAVRYHHRHIPVVSPKPSRTTTIVPFTAHGGFGVAVLLER